jgi:hypothetical protein
MRVWSVASCSNLLQSSREIHLAPDRPSSESEAAQTEVIVRPAAQWPVKLSIFPANWQVIDARMTHRHQAVFIKLPVLIAERAKPVSRIIMPFISEANGDPIALKRPKFLDQSVIELPHPLALEKTHDLLSADDELGPVASPALCAVGERHLFRITGVPSILSRSNFLDGRFERQRRERRPGFGGLRDHISYRVA